MGNYGSGSGNPPDGKTIEINSDEELEVIASGIVDGTTITASNNELSVSTSGLASKLADGTTIATNSNGVMYLPSLTYGNNQYLYSNEGTNAEYLYFSSDTAGSSVISSILTQGYSNTAGTTHQWFIVLPSSIAASTGTLTIYLQVSNTSQYNNTKTGVIANLTSTYGQYDNGASIFPEFYQNFTGTTLPSNWTAPSGTNYTVDNGITVTGSTASTAIYDSSISMNGSGYVYYWLTNQSNTGSDTNVQMNRYTANSNMWYIGNSTTAGYSNAGSEIGTETVPSTNSLYGIINSGTTVAWYYTDLSNSTGGITSVVDTTATSEDDYLSLVWCNQSTDTNVLYSVFAATPPPNNVYPTISIGTPVYQSTGNSYYIPITLSNTQSTAVASGTQIPISISNNTVLPNPLSSYNYQDLTAQTTTSTTSVNLASAVDIQPLFDGNLTISAIVRGNNNTLSDGITVSLLNGTTVLDSETYTQEGVASNSHTFALMYNLSVSKGNLYNIYLTFNAVSGGTASAKVVSFNTYNSPS